MRDFRVLFIYPNLRRMSLVPPSIGLLSKLLKAQGVKVDLFDTSYYTIVDNSRDSDEANKADLVTRPFDLYEKIKLKQSNVFEDLSSKVKEFKLNLISVSAEESTFLLGIRLFQSIRHHNILTIIGDVFATFAPERTISYPEIDIICVGEGEIALVELCDRLQRLLQCDQLVGQAERWQHYTESNEY